VALTACLLSSFVVLQPPGGGLHSGKTTNGRFWIY
jgi:hypothetical protein